MDYKIDGRAPVSSQAVIHFEKCWHVATGEVRKSRRRRLYLLLHHRLVSPPLAGLAGVKRSGEPNLCVEVLVKVVFSSRLS
jgi:hypothetical protein